MKFFSMKIVFDHMYNDFFEALNITKREEFEKSAQQMFAKLSEIVNSDRQASIKVEAISKLLVEHKADANHLGFILFRLIAVLEELTKGSAQNVVKIPNIVSKKTH